MTTMNQMLALFLSFALALLPYSLQAFYEAGNNEIAIPIGLEALEKLLKRDLEFINFPPRPWRILPSTSEDDPQHVFDVVIVGAGMSGLAASFALQQYGITNIKLLDEQPSGYEGPWATYARMKTLRSGKALMGPALSISNLT